ncbi:protein of unknown function [Prosthecobacter debontii]|uniref:GYF domain-containing protein n=1 Tax=Prosthecobacter debontii TaxID=48467 RepID=A0A1T4YHU9_9BACT|nr:DUF4339 domain-containing protein [Prosthecobacter debontii]SKB01283.1 protein of unknown function [Prosthecobacter debontii]
MEALYYISKGQKTVGPCTLDDLYSYVAYGSVRDNDLVRRDGSTEWTPLRSLSELETNTADQAKDITTRRRTARYRDYGKVPANRRSGIVIWRLIWGFLIAPPMLWKAAISIYQDRIYTPKKDDRGYLCQWPQWTERLVTGMLVLNGLVWVTLIWLLWKEATPLAREIIAMFSAGATALAEWLGQ